MARKRLKQDLYIYMNGMSVGILTRDSIGNLSFKYDPDWLHKAQSRPISLSMPLTEVPYKGRVVDCYFDNLLPDSEIILDRIQARFNAPSKKSFDLLARIGTDCVGALEILTQPKVGDVKTIHAKPIDNHGIARLLRHYQDAPLGMEEGSDFRISIAGAQEKTALLWHKNKWHLPHTTTPTSHILKLPIGQIKHSGIDLSESVENEWLCLRILSAFGLPVNEARIEKFEDLKVLVVKRFDRRWSEDGSWLMRLLQEDFCQVLGVTPGLKYESDGGPGMAQIMKILEGSKYAMEDRKKFMKSVFLFWVLGAIDGHAKNFSISIEAGGRYQLTPLYDVISAYPLVAKKQLQEPKLKMAMSLKSKNTNYTWSVIQPRQWLAMARYCQFPENEMQAIMAEVNDNLDGVIENVSSQIPANFPLQMCEAVFAGMRKIKRRISFSVRDGSPDYTAGSS